MSSPVRRGSPAKKYGRPGTAVYQEQSLRQQFEECQNECREKDVEIERL